MNKWVLLFRIQQKVEAKRLEEEGEKRFGNVFYNFVFSLKDKSYYFYFN